LLRLLMLRLRMHDARCYIDREEEGPRRKNLFTKEDI
jgi:hypothetical protein